MKRDHIRVKSSLAQNGEKKGVGNYTVEEPATGLWIFPAARLPLMIKVCATRTVRIIHPGLV